MKLLKLSCKNFKGLKEFSFEPDGKNAEILGANASGKTTIADAFFYLVNGKDSRNSANFEIKTIDSKTQEVKHNLDHEVEGVFFTDKEITLKKIYREVWAKSRGSAVASFSGHTTEYQIDGVDKPKSDFDAILEEIAPEKVFRLLTDPRFFNEVMPWKSIVPKKGKPTIGRRDLLIETFGDVSDADIIKQNKNLSGLTDILGDRSLDDHRSIIKARQTVINDALNKLPVRIDEVNRNLPDVSDLSKIALEKTSCVLAKEISEKQTEKANIQTGGQASELRKQLRMEEAKAIDAANQETKNTISRIDKKREEKGLAIDQLNDKNRAIKAYQDNIKANNTKSLELNAKRDNLLDRYREIKAEVFDPSVLPVCEECGHINGVEAAEKHFNAGKAQLLEENKKAGLKVRDELDTLNANIAGWLKTIADLEKETDETQKKITGLNEDIADLETVHPPAPDTPEIKKLKNDISKLEAGGGRDDLIQAVEKDLQDLEAKKQANADLLAEIKTVENAAARTKELEAEQTALSAEFEKLESELYLTEEFIRAKVKVLEEKINSRFKYAQFKLFDIQVNGGLNEVCECIVDGVPYSSMNNAARINAGLDIINTFSGIYGFSAPIFIDNAEAINDIFPVDTAQVIKLTVAKNKKLKIEIEKETENNE